MRSGGSGVRVQAQGRAYVAVVGVTVGMLIAGLAVPLAFGRTPGSARDEATNALQIDDGFAAEVDPMASAAAAPGAAAPGASQPGASAGAAAPGTPGAIGVTAPGAQAAPVAPGAAGAAGSGLKATDQGVTATSVKVGVVILDIRALEPLGFSQPNFQPADQRQRFQAYFDQINKTGGLSGRRVTPVFAEYDPLDSNGSRSGAAVCIRLARDEKVFIGLGFLDGNIAECLTQQYGIPAIANVGHVAESYTKGRNLLATPFAALERGTANWGDLISRSGVLKDRKTATLFGDGPQEARPEKSLVDALKAGGHTVTYRSKLGGDPATVQSQIPVEISQMQRAGVNTVFLVTNFVTAIQFANAAESQGFRPQYLVSDLGSLTAAGLVRSMPQSFDGALAYSMSLQPTTTDPPANKKCLDTYNANASGRDYANVREDGGVMTLICWMVTAFEGGADLLGAQLTRPGMASAFQRLTISLPHTQPGSFRAGKTDYADYLRPLRYDRSCQCYQPLGPSRRGRYS